MSGHSLASVVRRFPTPKASPSGPDFARLSRETSDGGDDLATFVARFPTPAARDYRYPNDLPYSERGGGAKGEQLPNVVGGPLNPTFVEWLMGFPLGWTVLLPSATRSSRKSRNS
jgi:hypothetical protein